MTNSDEMYRIPLWGTFYPGKNIVRKYCDKEFNIRSHRTLRIGNLYSFRVIEDEALRDEDEGIFKFSFDGIPGGHMDVSRDVWNTLQSAAYVRTLTHIGGPNGIGDQNALSVSNGSSIGLEVPNSWIFCLSFETAGVAGSIGKRYLDYWEFSSSKIAWIAEFISNQINHCMQPRHISQIAFDRLNFLELRSRFEIRRLVGEVVYGERKLMVPSLNVLQNQAIGDAVKRANFIKPLKFEAERELRLVFSPFVAGVQIPVSKEPLDIDLKPILTIFD